MRKLLAAAIAALSLTVAAPAAAQTLQLNGSGILTGVTGVTVEGTVYDVTLVDTTCAVAFGACSSAADFDFQTEASAMLAASALDQLLIGIQPNNILGCGADATFCALHVPFALTAGTRYDAFAYRWDSGSHGAATVSYGQDWDFGDPNFKYDVFAVFTLAAPAGVPEPATWAMMLFGFGAVGFQLRRKRRPILAQAA